MYLGVDIGGTKTFVASLDEHGVITERIRFETDHDYPTFLGNFVKALHTLKEKHFKAVGVGMPASELDRDNGIGVAFGNLPWKNVPIRDDIARITTLPVALENDAKLGGLSEAMLLKKDFRKVLYITISTGIGTALVVDQVIDPNVGDAGGRTMLFQHHGAMKPWESFASGKAIVERFNKRAEDIHDGATWKIMAHNWRPGFLQLIAITDPDVIVIGGSVGTYFDRYGKILYEELAAYETPLMPIPEIRGAARAEDAVLYGCYDYAVQRFGKRHA